MCPPPVWIRVNIIIWFLYIYHCTFSIARLNIFVQDKFIFRREAKTGFTAPQSAELVNKPCQCTHTPGRQTPLQPEKTIN